MFMWGEYEEIKKSDRVNSAGRACYVEHNQWMIGNSSFVIVYLREYNKKSKPSGKSILLLGIFMPFWGCKRRTIT